MARYIRLGLPTFLAICVGLVIATYVVTTQTARESALNDFLSFVGKRELGGSTADEGEFELAEGYWPAKSLPKQVKNGTNVTILIRNPRPFDLQPKNITLANRADAHLQLPQDFKSRPPQAIIMGFAKCGTSAIIEFLALHPKIVPLEWEPDYFCDRVYPKYDIQWYVKRMPPTHPDQITIEKSPCYIVEHDAHIRMAAFNNTVKLIVLVRHPITRLLSTYAHFKSVDSYWGLGSKSLEERFFDSKKNEFKAFEVLKFAEYTSHFEHLLKYFKRQQLLILDGDKLITDPLSQIARVEDFLGLKHEITDKDIYYDENKKFYCMRQRIEGTSNCLGDHKGRQHEQLEPGFRKRLLAYLKPHNEKFFSLVGERFDWSE